LKQRKESDIAGHEVMLERASQEVMPGGASGEVRLATRGSDAGAFAPGTKRRALARWANSVTRFWNSFVGANGCSPEEVNGEMHLTAINVQRKADLNCVIPYRSTTG